MNIQTAQQTIDREHVSVLDPKILKAKLLAAMSKTDGKVLEVENFFAGSVLKSIDKDQLHQLKTVYAEELERPLHAAEISYFIEELVMISPEEQAQFLQLLSALAACDGEIHASEQALIDTYMRKLNIK